VYARSYFGKTVLVVFNRNTEDKEITVQLPSMFAGKKYNTTFNSKFSLNNDVLKINVKKNGVEVLVEK
jgi:hypothetical protein